MMAHMELCKETDCGKPLAWERSDCPACGAYAGPPNIRHAAREQAALEQRFQAALTDCQNRHAEAVAQDFVDQVEHHSAAVINGDAKFFLHFFNDGNSLYASYQQSTAASIRIAGEIANDVKRLATEALIFGHYGYKIRYAALSLNGQGLHSYGSCSMVLNQSLCKNKASLTEDNTYVIAEKNLTAFYQQKDMPSGIRARWQERHKLALAKHGPALTAASNAGDFADLLLYCAGERATDRFMEVHIYDAFSSAAVSAATLPKSGKNQREDDDLEDLFDKLTAKSIPCTRR